MSEATEDQVKRIDELLCGKQQRNVTDLTLKDVMSASDRFKVCETHEDWYKRNAAKTVSRPETANADLIKATFVFMSACGSLVDLVKRTVFYKLKQQNKQIPMEKWIEATEKVMASIFPIIGCIYADIEVSVENKIGLPIDLIHGSFGHFTEAGEVAEALEKDFGGSKSNDTIKNLKEELGDHEWYTQLMITQLNVSRSELWISNINKLRSRFPDGTFDEVAVLNRNIEAEQQALDLHDHLGEDQ